MAVSLAWAIAVAGLVGGILGAFVMHYVASWRDKQKEVREAGRQFREAFVAAQYFLSIRHPEQGRLFSGSLEEYQDTYSLVRKCHKQHYEALVRLKPYLSKSKQVKLEQAWEQYCCCKSDPSQRYALYQDYKSTEDIEEQWSKRALALDRIGKMFQYTW
jgi:hypothetical protein